MGLPMIALFPMVSDLSKLLWNIKTSLRNMGYSGFAVVKAVGDVSTSPDHGLRFFDIPSVFPRERRKTILASMQNHTQIYVGTGERLNFVLLVGDISRDLEFLDALRSVKSGGFCNILLSQPRAASGKVPPDCGSTEFVWESQAAGPCPATPPTRLWPITS
ncbi:unnamed protein product [Arabis nemorensis]|uniref:NYN domain-containing protein n=1 Tax=Arabis nemorensis TaxID=586526 RepID=A0A565BYW5_9BRAS|nr:unnamed protein product [Arabis nemorensis]